MIIRIGICDDDEYYINEIKQLIIGHFEKSDNQYTIKIYLNGEGLFQDSNVLDILFLDIEMNNINGIDIKERLSLISSDCKIVFVTNYDQRMQEAFGSNVIGFISKMELDRIDKILSKIEREQDGHLIIKIGDMSYDMSENVYMEASGSYTIFHMLEKDVTCAMNLKKVLHQYDMPDFIKVHRSFVINMKYIKDIECDKVTLINNEKIKISRKYGKEVPLKYFDFVRGRKL